MRAEDKALAPFRDAGIDRRGPARLNCGTRCVARGTPDGALALFFFAAAPPSRERQPRARPHAAPETPGAPGAPEPGAQGMENPVMDAIVNRRSIRRFTDEHVSPDDIAAILEAGRFAPSGLNNQPCRFLVLTGADPRRETLAGMTKYARIVREAPVLICLFLDASGCYNRIKDCQGAGAAMQNMLLCIHSLGLGGVWLGEIINQEPRVTEALSLDSGRYELMAVIALGHPAAKGSSSRMDISEYMIEPFPGS